MQTLILHTVNSLPTQRCAWDGRDMFILNKEYSIGKVSGKLKMM